MTDPAAYGFLPWVRSGLASLAKTQPTQNFVSMQVGLTVNTTATSPVAVRLYGPGQVTGVDPRAITRKEPTPGSVSFEPNYFPFVELATPDFPWMFSPAVPSGAVLRPWLCLVAVKLQPGVTLAPRGNLLPLLEFSAPATPVSELPDLNEITNWAHAQVNGSAASGLTAAGSLSRIICPRQLEPNTAYLACLVPTYNAGVQAGISPDLPGDDSDVTPAWSATITTPFSLPVYAYWTFSTGEAGDFASLARRLGAPSTPLDVGLAPMEESAPGFGMPAFPGLALGLEGALMAPQTSSTAWPPGVQAQFAAALGPILTPPAGPDPIVTPPMYGTWPAGGTQPTWLHDLNFDPRMRAAAGFGVRAVRADAENLIASAWDQFQQLRQANQRLRQFQLARVVAQTTLTRQVNALEGAGSFLQLTQPMHTRLLVALGTTATVHAHLTASRISSGAVAPAFRRLARRRGPLGRQLFPLASPPSQFVERLNQVAGTPRALSVVAQLIAPAGTVLLDAVSQSTTATLLTATAVAAAPGWTATAVTTGTIVTVGTVVTAGSATTIGTVTTAGSATTAGTATKAGTVTADGLATKAETVTIAGTTATTGAATTAATRARITTGPAIAAHIANASGTPIATEPTVAAGAPIATDPTVAAGAPIAIDPAVAAGSTVAAGTTIGGTILTPPALPLRSATNLQDDPTSPVWLRSGMKTFPLAPEFPPVLSDYIQMEARFRAAATQVVNYINEKTALISDEPELPQLTATLATAQSLIIATLDPTKTLAARAGAQLLLPSTGDPLRPQIGAPVFTQPMSLALTPQQLLPGASEVPDETAALLVTNPRFIEAYMVGLNDEMRRELAWRQYPVVSNATFFANFWGSAPDIPAIASWAATAPLGSNADTHNAQVVLLVRGELLRRFPNSVIIAVPATGTAAQRQLGPNEITPTFRGTIDPDMTFFGFSFTEATATAGLGYYFVLAEHPSEPRFGLAATVAGAGTTLADWNDLAWSQVTVVNNHVSVAEPPTATGPGARWGADAANQAYIAYRQPMRIAFLTNALLG
jgi:hypothetical protein